MIRTGKYNSGTMKHFPDEPDKDLVLIFLHRNGFKESDLEKSVQMADRLAKESPAYITGRYNSEWDTKWIMFCPKDSKKVFFLRTDDCGERVDSHGDGCLFYSVNNGPGWSNIKDYRTFVDAVETEMNL